jgi:hypothetical protein
MQLSSDPDPKTMNFTTKEKLAPSNSYLRGRKLKQYEKSKLLKILTLTLADELQDRPVQTSKQEKITVVSSVFLASSGRRSLKWLKNYQVS